MQFYIQYSGCKNKNKSALQTFFDRCPQMLTSYQSETNSVHLITAIEEELTPHEASYRFHDICKQVENPAFAYDQT